jgi:hypothetical protein
MQFWTVCFLLFFLLTQIYQLVKAVSVPMPVSIAGGILLAIASNIRRSSSLSVAPAPPKPPAPLPEPAPASLGQPTHPPIPTVPVSSTPPPPSP